MRFFIFWLLFKRKSLQKFVMYGVVNYCLLLYGFFRSAVHSQYSSYHYIRICMYVCGSESKFSGPKNCPLFKKFFFTIIVPERDQESLYPESRTQHRGSGRRALWRLKMTGPKLNFFCRSTKRPAIRRGMYYCLLSRV